MTINDTICAIATPRGVGGISIVRVSGGNSLFIAKSITKMQDFTPRFAYLKNIYSSTGAILDSAIVIYFEAPFSFTGETIVEFQCHGGEIVVDMLVDEILMLGARAATGGEFLKRAFLNGKIDLTMAEATAKLIESKSRYAALILARQLKGSLREYIENIRDELLGILAYSEVSIDYADEELPNDIFVSIESRLNKIKTELEKSLSISKKRENLMSGFRVAIIGKPNVGKSSILNNLLSYKRAIVSDIAGTTRDTVEGELKIGSHIVKLIDTAGIRETDDTIEQIGIDLSKNAADEANLILAVFDNSRKFDDEDKNIIDFLRNKSSNKEILAIINKIDLPSCFDKTVLREFETIEGSQKEHQDGVLLKLASFLNGYDMEDDSVLISKHQISSVESCLRSLQMASELLNTEELELFSYNIKDAISEIGQITRPFEFSEMLDKMFSTFCLGK